jgi:hypothetical protein
MSERRNVMSFWGAMGLVILFLIAQSIYSHFQRRQRIRVGWTLYRLAIQSLRNQISDFNDEVDSLTAIDEGRGMYNLGMLNGLRRSYVALKSIDDFYRYIKEKDLDLEAKEAESTEEQLREIRHEITDKSKGAHEPTR